METLKAAVIGAGNMGKNHIRLYSELPGVELAAVSDLNIEAAQGFAKQYSCNAYKDYGEMLAKEKPDAVSVVVPTAFHAKVGGEVLAKASALVEKPIALNEEDAAKLISAGKASGNKLMVGHIERFNPIIKYLQDFAEKDEFLAFNIMRLGPYTPKSRTTGVLMDMGIHDIDLVRYITKSEPVSVDASYRHVNISDFEDQAHVFMKMPGPSASLVCNWISPVKIRHLYAVTTKAFLYLDFITQEATIHEPGKEGAEAEHVKLEYEEPLKRELSAFLECVRDGTESPVSGEDALESVRVALRADKIAQKSDPHMR
ncbi:Gfo/Idh/MocA family oxidoreductase [archaeon]